MNNLSYIDEFFIQALSTEIETARQEGETERLERLQALLKVIEEFSTPAEFKLIDEFLEAADDEDALAARIEEHSDDLTDEFMNNLTGIMNQVEQRLEEMSGEERARQEEVLQRLELVHQKAVRHSMERKFKAN